MARLGGVSTFADGRWTTFDERDRLAGGFVGSGDDLRTVIQQPDYTAGSTMDGGMLWFANGWDDIRR